MRRWCQLCTRPTRLSLIFIVLAHWNNSPRIDMSTHPYTLSRWFGASSPLHQRCGQISWKINLFGKVPSNDMLLQPEEWWFGLVWFMVFNATFNNISAISWRSVLLVVETWVPGENHRPVASHWQTFIT